jgi:hypothetical protein
MTGSRSKIVHRPKPQDDPRQRRPDISKAQELLKWSPHTSLQEGLKMTIAYFEEMLKADGMRALLVNTAPRAERLQIPRRAVAGTRWVRGNEATSSAGKLSTVYAGLAHVGMVNVFNCSDAFARSIPLRGSEKLLCVYELPLKSGPRARPSRVRASLEIAAAAHRSRHRTRWRSLPWSRP